MSDHNWVNVLQLDKLKYGDEVKGMISGLMAYAGEVTWKDDQKAVITKQGGGTLTVHQLNLGTSQPRPAFRGGPALQWITVEYCDNPEHPGRHRFTKTEIITIQAPTDQQS